MTTIYLTDGTIAAPGALGTGRTGGHALLTFADAFDLGVAFLNGHGREASSDVIRRAVQEAHLDIINAYDWPSLEGAGRIHLHAAQATGTVTYDNTTRYLTLSGSTWPSWVEDGSLLLNETICEVETYISPTLIVLHESLNPGVDLVAGTTYSLFCRWYPLPTGFVNFTRPMGRNGWAYGQPISMSEMAGWQRNYGSTGTIQYYAIGERPNAPGEKALFIWPFASASEPLDFNYQRRPRELQYSGRDVADTVGTITAVAGSNAIVGSSTTFDSGMAGAMLLIGSSTTDTPTGRYGLNRFAEQHRIHSSTTAAALTLRDNVTTSRAGVKYVVTDPIEIETCAHGAFMRYVEMHLAMTLGLDINSPHGSYTTQYVALAEKALRNAMAASYPIRNDPSQSHSGYGPTGIIDRSAYE
jgi:hypothetical protein